MPLINTLLAKPNVSAEEIRACTRDLQNREKNEFLENKELRSEYLAWLDQGQNALVQAFTLKRFDLVEPLLEWFNAVNLLKLSGTAELRAGKENIILKAINELPEEQFIDFIKTIAKFPALKARLRVACRYLGSQLLDPIKPQETHAVKTAIGRKNVNLVKAILEYSESQPSSMQALNYAVRMGTTDIVDYLLTFPKHSLDLTDSYGYDGLTPLMFTVTSNNVSMANRLLRDPRIKKEIDYKNEIWETALHLALMQKNPNPEMIRLLLQNGADPEQRDLSGRSPIDLLEELRRANNPSTTVLQGIFEENRLRQLVQEQSAIRPAPPRVLEDISRDFQDRMNKIKTPMTDSLFGHINDDHTLKGSVLEGNAFNNTVFYASEFLNLIANQTIPLDLGKVEAEELSLLTTLANQFTESLVIDKRITATLQAGLNIRIEDKQKRKAEQAILLDGAVKDIVEEFLTRKTIIIPAGWLDATGGHAMLYEVKQEPSGELQINIFNSGDGIQFHESSEMGQKEKYKPVTSFRIPANKANNISDIIKLIIEPKLKPVWEKKLYDGQLIYANLLQKLTILGGERIPAPRDVPYITGQRSGTCSWKVIAAFLKARLPKKLYQQIKFELKFQSVLEYFSRMTRLDRLSDSTMQELLRDAIENLNTLIQKNIEVEQQTPQRYRQAILTLEQIKNTLDMQKLETFTSITAGSNLKLSEFEGEKYQASEISSVEKPDLEPKKELPGTEAFTYELIESYQSPETDLEKLLKKIHECEVIYANDPKKSTYLIKIIESWFLKVPITGEKANQYWQKITDKDGKETAFIATQKLAEIQRIYLQNCAQVFNSPYPSRVVTTASIFSCLCILGNTYFKRNANDDGNNFILSWECKSFREHLKQRIAENPLFYIADRELDDRFKEISTLHAKLQAYKSYSGVSFNPYSQASRAAGFNKAALDSRTETELQKILAEKQHSKLISISNLENYRIKIAFENSPDVLPAEAQRNINMVEISEMVLMDAESLLMNNYSLYKNSKLSANEAVVGRLQQQHMKCRIISDKTNEKNGRVHLYRVDALISRPGEKPKLGWPLDDIHLQQPQSPVLERFKLSKLFEKEREIAVPDSELQELQPHKVTTANKIQMLEVDKELTADVVDTRLVLHTRSVPGCQVVTSIDYILSDLGKLEDIDYQTWLTINLFNPQLLAKELEKNPAAAGAVIKFIQKGLQHYTEGNKIAKPVPFLLKINQYLKGFLADAAQPLQDKLAPYLQECNAISLKIDHYIQINHAAGQVIQFESEKRANIHLQRKLYGNLLQEIESQCKAALKTGKPISEALIKKYLQATSYININSGGKESPQEKLDPLIQDLQNNLVFIMTPILKKYFETAEIKAVDEITRIVEHSLPKSLITEIHAAASKTFSFPYLICRPAAESDNNLIIDVTTGKIARTGGVMGLLPEWVYNNDHYTQFFGEKSHNCTIFDMGTDKERVQFTDEQTGCNYLIQKSSGKLFKAITLDGKTNWFQYQRVRKDTNEDNDTMGYHLNALPPVLLDHNAQAWISTEPAGAQQEHIIVISDKHSGQNTYVVKDRKCQTLQPDGTHTRYEMVRLYDLGGHLESTPFDFLKQFEGAGFIEVFKKKSENQNIEDSDYLIHLPRYGLHFKAQKDGKGQYQFIWQENPSYEIDFTKKSDIIPHFSSYLPLKAVETKKEAISDLILVPRSAFIATGSKMIDLDKQGMLLEDLHYKETKGFSANYSQKVYEFNPGYWSLAQSAQYTTLLRSKDGKIKGKTNEDCLHLAYLYLGKKQPKEAYKALRQFKSKGGLQGNLAEARLLKWILRDIPLQLDSMTVRLKAENTVLHQGEAKHTSPEQTAVKAQVLVSLLDFLGGQKKFDLQSKHIHSADGVFEKEEAELLTKFLGPENIKKIIENLLKQYLQDEKNMPAHMKLSSEDQFYLYSFLTIDQLPSAMVIRFHELTLAHHERIQSAKLTVTAAGLSAKQTVAKRRKEIVIEQVPFVPPNSPELIKFMAEGAEEGTDFSEAHAFQEMMEKEVLIEPKDFSTMTFIQFVRASSDVEKYLRGQAYIKEDREIPVTQQQRQDLLGFLRKYVIGLLTAQDALVIKRMGGEDAFAYLAGFLLYIAEYPAEFADIRIDEFQKFIATIHQLPPQKKLKFPVAVNKATYQEVPKPQKPIVQAMAFPNMFLSAQEVAEDIPSMMTLLKNLNLGINAKEIEEEVKQHAEIVGIDAALQEECQEGERLNKRDKKLTEARVAILKKDDNMALLKNNMDKIKSDLGIKLYDERKGLKKKLIDFANHIPDKDPENLIAKVQQMGRERPKLSLRQILNLFLKGDMLSYQEKTHLSPDQIRTLHQMTTEFLVESTKLQQYERAEEQLTEVKKAQALAGKGVAEADNYQKELDKLAEVVYATRTYDYADKVEGGQQIITGHPAHLFPEYYLNLLIRESQTELLGILLEPENLTTGGFKNKISQLIMGGGKSKLLLPISAYRKAKGDNLPIILVPQALYKTNFQDLAMTSERLFNQKALSFEFDRQTDCSPAHLDKIIEYLQRGILNKSYLVTTNTAIQAVELKWLELLAEGQPSSDRLIHGLFNSIKNMPFKFKGKEYVLSELKKAEQENLQSQQDFEQLIMTVIIPGLFGQLLGGKTPIKLNEPITESDVALFLGFFSPQGPQDIESLPEQYRRTPMQKSWLNACVQFFQEGIPQDEKQFANGERIFREVAKDPEFTASYPLENDIQEIKRKEVVGKLETLLGLFKNKGDVLIDEIDVNLDIKKELNYTIGGADKLRATTIQDAIELFALFPKISFSIGNEPYTLEKILLGKQPKLSENEWKKLYQNEIAEAIAKVLIADPKDPDAPKSPIRSICSKLTPAETDALKAYLLNRTKIKPDFLESERLNDTERDKLTLYKEEISNLLPLSLIKIPNVNYGYPRDAITGKPNGVVPIPYLGNETPNPLAQFASPFETMNYAIQLNKIYGISDDIFIRFIKSFREQAQLEKTQSGGQIKLSDTKAAAHFASLTGGTWDLFALDPENVQLMTSIHSEIKDKLHYTKVIDYCLSNFILNQIDCYPTILKQNSLNHSSLYRSVQGFSGTILSSFIFDERTEFRADLAKGTDGKTINHLLRKKTAVHVAKEDDQFATVTDLLKNNPDFRAVIDVGAYFRGIDNLTVAKRLGEFYTIQNPNIKYILYYNTEDKLCALCLERNRKNEIIVIGSTEPKDIASHLGSGIGPEQYFTYYDERRITGTDIKQKTNARALVTFGAHTILRDILQGTMRMRDLANTHEIEMIIPKDIAQAYPEIQWDIQSVINFSSRNQKSVIKEYDFRAAMEKLKNVIRENILIIIRSEDSLPKKRSMLSTFKDIILQIQSQSPYNLFGQLEDMQELEIVLQNEKARLIGILKKGLLIEQRPISVGEEAKITVQLDKIIQKATVEGVCDAMVKVPTRSNKDVEVQTVTETTSESLTESQKQTQKETQQLLQLGSGIAGPESYKPWPSDLELSTIQLSSYKKDQVYFEGINQLIPKGVKSDQKPGFSFGKNIYMSANFIKNYQYQKDTLLDGFFKPIHRVLMVQNKHAPHRLEAYIITQEESDQFEALLAKQKTEIDKVDKNIWIMTAANEIVTAGEPPPDLAPNYHTTLEQIWYLNANNDAMVRHLDELEWFRQGDGAAKLKFYEEVILPCHPNRRNTYPYFKAELQSRLAQGDLKESREEEELEEGPVPPPILHQFTGQETREAAVRSAEKPRQREGISSAAAPPTEDAALTGQEEVKSRVEPSFNEDEITRILREMEERLQELKQLQQQISRLGTEEGTEENKPPSEEDKRKPPSPRK